MRVASGPDDSAYYRWRQAEREPCERRRRDVEPTERIKEMHAESGGIYGSPRVHAALKREGVHVGRKRVERDFTASEPNRLWVTALTMITTGEGPLVALGDPGKRTPAGWSPGGPPPARTPTWS
ncbi:IS3 family transposase [Streptomyces europaeiscabiei]|uniref:IS3 family transposase n=1 Tax=Streptomyces europaeiscabiei TaxID=146819 RepID=UPI0029A4AE83|nr:IS3 family transposase [Streptomyces europaeiscabiei]MDX3775835.1 IS3 family transposase [Streptomyces europaeiscabiei]